MGAQEVPRASPTIIMCEDDETDESDIDLDEFNSEEEEEEYTPSPIQPESEHLSPGHCSELQPVTSTPIYPRELVNSNVRRQLFSTEASLDTTNESEGPMDLASWLEIENE